MNKVEYQINRTKTTKKRKKTNKIMRETWNKIQNKFNNLLSSHTHTHITYPHTHTYTLILASEYAESQYDRYYSMGSLVCASYALAIVGIAKLIHAAHGFLLN